MISAASPALIAPRSPSTIYQGLNIVNLMVGKMNGIFEDYLAILHDGPTHLGGSTAPGGM